MRAPKIPARDISLQIRVGDITAHCQQCGWDEFDARAASEDPQETYTCVRCRAPATRIFLLTQVAGKTVQHLTEYLDAFHKRRARKAGRKRPSTVRSGGSAQ
jgi:hypothetical protein